MKKQIIKSGKFFVFSVLTVLFGILGCAWQTDPGIRQDDTPPPGSFSAWNILAIVGAGAVLIFIVLFAVHTIQEKKSDARKERKEMDQEWEESERRVKEKAEKEANYTAEKNKSDINE